MIQIVPNIITNDLKEAEDKLKKLQGLVDLVHIDILDGKFTDTKTITLNQLKNVNLPRNINVLLHLMVDNPFKFINIAKEIEAKVVIAQIEMMPNQKDFVEEVIKSKMEVGLALDDGTTIEKVDKQLLSRLDVILVMTIKAGWSGREFKKERLREIRKLKNLKTQRKLKFKIAVDGGVNRKTIKGCVKAGAELLFAHSAIWQSKDVKKTIEDLRSLYKNNPSR